MSNLVKSLYDNIPGVLIVLGVLLGIQLGVGFLSYLGIFYWVLFRFDLVPISLLCLLGILYDSFSGPFIGLEMCLFSVFALIVYLEQRLFRQLQFGQLWIRFGALLSIVFIGKFIMFPLGSVSFAILPQLVSFFTTFLLFPFYVKGMHPLYQRLSTI